MKTQASALYKCFLIQWNIDIDSFGQDAANKIS